MDFEVGLRGKKDNVAGLEASLLENENKIVKGFAWSIFYKNLIDELYGFAMAPKSKMKKANGVVLDLCGEIDDLKGVYLSVNPRILGKGKGLELGVVGVAGEMYGGQANLVYNGALKSRGFQLGAWNETGDGKGVQLGCLNNVGEYSGLRFGVVNKSKKATGFEFGVVNFGDEYTGIQTSILGNRSKKNTGGQYSVLYNSADETTGMQTGLVNYSKKMKGVQFGLINICGEDSKGLQIGLINYRPNAKWYKRFIPFIAPRG